MHFSFFLPSGSSIPTEPTIVPKKVCRQNEKLSLIHVLFICKKRKKKKLIVTFFSRFYGSCLGCGPLSIPGYRKRGHISRKGNRSLHPQEPESVVGIPLSSFKDPRGSYSKICCCISPSRAKNTKWLTILRNTGGKCAINSGIVNTRTRDDSVLLIRAWSLQRNRLHSIQLCKGEGTHWVAKIWVRFVILNNIHNDESDK